MCFVFTRYRSAVHVTQGNTTELGAVLEVVPIAEQVPVTAEAGLVSDKRQVDTQVNIISERKIIGVICGWFNSY